MVTEPRPSPAALLELLEHGDPHDLVKAGFSHREHLAVAWALVRAEPLGHAIERLCTNLRRVTAVLGVPEKYNETLTWAWMVIVAERCAEAPPNEDFAAFLERNADLLDQRATLATYYDATQLRSSAAQRRFTLPRRPSAHAHG
jgi:hypothetical protein